MDLYFSNVSLSASAKIDFKIKCNTFAWDFFYLIRVILAIVLRRSANQLTKFCKNCKNELGIELSGILQISTLEVVVLAISIFIYDTPSCSVVNIRLSPYRFHEPIICRLWFSWSLSSWSRSLSVITCTTISEERDSFCRGFCGIAGCCGVSNISSLEQVF